jgi:hypothetical protein
MGATTPYVHVGSLYRSVQHALLAIKGAKAAHTPGEVVPAQRDGHTVREGTPEVADLYREMGVPPGCW